MPVTAPPISPTKDVHHHPAFRSALVRWFWRLYTQRLTRAGQWLMWPSVVFGAYGGMSLQNQGYVAAAYVLALWLVALVCVPLFRPRVRLNADHVDRVCCGENLPVDVEIEQTGGARASDLQVLAHRLPPEVDATPETVELPVLSRGKRFKTRLGLLCKKRGVYTLRGYRVQTDFPFGLMNAWRFFEQERKLVVYPKFHRLGRLNLPTGKRYNPGGVAMVSNLGESFDFVGNREYREGDNVRDIDWRATARLTTPIVREYREEYLLRTAVILDTHMPKRAKAAAHDAFERAVSVSAAVSDYMARQDYLVDIFAAGPNLYHLTAGRSLAYLDQILDILACVQENRDEPFATIEPELMENLSKITTVICVLLDWNDNRRAFVNRLAEQGAGVKVIIVRDSPTTLPPIEDSHLVGPIRIVTKEQFEAKLEEL